MPRCFVSFVSRLKQSKTQQVDGIINITERKQNYIQQLSKCTQPNVNNTNHVTQALSGNTIISGRSPISLDYLISNQGRHYPVASELPFKYS